MTMSLPIILLVHHSNQISGAEKSLIDFLSEFYLNPNRQFEIIVGLPSGGDLGKYLVEANFKFLYFPFFRLKRKLNPIYLIFAICRVLLVTFYLCKYLRRNKVDLIHANTTTACLESLIAAKLSGIPIIGHVRDEIRPGLLRKILEKHVDCILGVSGFVLKDFKAKNVVLYNGVRFNQSRLPHIPSYKLNSSISGNILMIGQVVPWKRHDLIIRTMAYLKPHYPQLKLMIIGDDLFSEHGKYLTTLKKKSLN